MFFRSKLVGRLYQTEFFSTPKKAKDLLKISERGTPVKSKNSTCFRQLPGEWRRQINVSWKILNFLSPWSEKRCGKKKLLFINMNFCSWSINKQVKVSYLQQIWSSTRISWLEVSVRHPYETSFGWWEKIKTRCSFASEKSNWHAAALVWLHKTISKVQNYALTQ